MKVKGKYRVTFNMDIGGREIGDTRECTVDFVGDDIDALADEVITNEPGFPMSFNPVDEDNVVGWFYDVEDPEGGPVAAMYQE